MEFYIFWSFEIVSNFGSFDMAQDRLSCFEFFVLGACAPLCESLPLALIIYFAYFAFFAAKSLLSFGCGVAALGSLRPFDVAQGMLCARLNFYFFGSTDTVF